MNDETHDDPGERGEDALDVNLRELLRRAPEPARLDAAGRARMADALRMADASGAAGGAGTPGALHATGPVGPRDDARHASGRASAPRPARVVRRRAFLAAAAVLAVAALGALLLDPFGADGEDGADRGEDVVAREGGVDPDALPGAGAPGGDAAERAPVDVADGEGEEQLATADGIDADGARDDVLGTLRFAEGDAPADLTEIEVWSRPALTLPRVADSERRLVAVEGAAPTGDAPLAFRLRGERARARALGAERIHITAIAPGFGRVGATVPVGTGGDPIALQFAPGATVRGVVTDARTGTPVEGALVLPLTGLPLDSLDVAQRGSDALPRPWAETDANGRFELEGVERGSLRIRASAPGFAPSSAEPTNLDEFARAVSAGEPPPAMEVSLALEPGGSVEGVVEREDGSRFAGALVIASFNDVDTRPGPRGPLTFGGAVADALGRYRIDDLPGGPHVVLVFDADGGRGGAPKAFRFARVERGETRTVDFLSTASSGAGGSIVGTLRGPEGAPVAGAPLTIGPSEGGESDWAATTTDGEGAFRFDDLAPETYTLLAAEDDFRSLSLVWSGRVDGPETLDLTLTGHRIALAPVAHDDASQGWQRIEDGWAMFERRTADGEWEFAGSAVLRPGRDGIRGVPAGRYRATYVPTEARPLGVAFSEPFDVPDPNRAPVTLRVRGGGALDVVAVDADGRPIAGAVVEVLLPEVARTVPTQEPVITDAEGRATLPAVPTGRVRIRVRATDGRSASAELEHDATAAAPARVTLDG